MTRGQLDDDALDAIQSRVPPLRDLRRKSLSLAPDVLAIKFGSRSYIPVASVCFHDCTEMIAQARYALIEHFAHGHYYRKHLEPADPIVATFFERYYLDDAALRLYAAGEHLANAVIFMLDLQDEHLGRYRKRNRTSQQAVVAAYLKDERKDWTLTDVLFRLGTSKDWQFTMDYRNRWVHEQPPTVAGLGVQYRRALPWKFSAEGAPKYLAVGSGDEAEYEIEMLAPRIVSAFTLALCAVDSALEEYYAILAARGIVRDDGKITMRLGL